MPLVAVGAQRQVVEDPCGRPQRRGAGGQAVDARRLELLAVGDEFVPAFRLFDARRLVGVAVEVDAPLVIGVGHAPLLAVDGHRRLGRGQRIAQAVGFPDIRHVLELAGVDEGRHPVAGIPVRQIRRVGGQEVADRGLVAFMVEVVDLHVDIGVRGLEIGDQRLDRGQRNRVVVGVVFQHALFAPSRTSTSAAPPSRQARPSSNGPWFPPWWFHYVKLSLEY